MNVNCNGDKCQRCGKPPVNVPLKGWILQTQVQRIDWICQECVRQLEAQKKEKATR